MSAVSATHASILLISHTGTWYQVRVKTSSIQETSVHRSTFSSTGKEGKQITDPCSQERDLGHIFFGGRKHSELIRMLTEYQCSIMQTLRVENFGTTLLKSPEYLHVVGMIAPRICGLARNRGVLHCSHCQYSREI